jgi:hypothetical protein
MSEEQEDNKPEGTSIEIGGVKFTGGKMFAIATALSAGIGTLYGGFEVYKDYMDMKKQIQEYVAPDLSKYDEAVSVLNQRQENTERLTRNNSEMLGMVSESMSRGVQSAMRSVDAMDSRTRENDRAMATDSKELLQELRSFDRENQQRMKQLETSTEEKIQKTLANPLANSDD